MKERYPQEVEASSNSRTIQDDYRGGRARWIGIDGCRAGWFYFGLDDAGEFSFGLLPRFDQVGTLF